MKELSKQYNPKEVEGRIYKFWEKKGYFKPADDQRPATSNQKPFVIVIPPPNITGSLHMGHALNNTLQDILIRRSRMKGVPTLWLPGTDHAGIATQSVVEKQLDKKGTNRQKLGREEFVKRVEAHVEEYGHIIIDQLKQLGCSCDWSRLRYTMDKEYSEAVNTAFKHYYDKGWIYQGERVINWCTKHQTSLSDIEVEHKEQPATLYYFKYDKNFPIAIATTRPETKLGDTAVAVNPDDSRYKQYIGKEFKINFAGQQREIKVIADRNVDPKFGTGALGVTPAHSIVDADMAEKNDLASITVIDRYGKMTKEAGTEYEGLKTTEAREKVLERLKKESLLEKEEEIINNLSVCYRCGRELEPQPSKQWFLKMSELIKPAIKAIEDDEIKITPERWKKVYLDWMENIRDWCISRQIWWGHRLPVFEKTAISNSQLSISKQNPSIENSKIENSLKIANEVSHLNCKLKIYVGDNPPTDYVQSPDVLDTWFSSALWPFATLGWPARHASQLAGVAGRPQKSDLDYFYPTNVLSTARDINMLWVVRMIFSGYEFMGKKPFSAVYIHPTVFNKEGKRMSKSLGTGVDPLELIEKYGTDAVRFGLTFQDTGTQDMKFDENAIMAGQKFANKIWNISRFIMINLENDSHSERSEESHRNLSDPTYDASHAPASQDDIVPDAKTEEDKKILTSMENLIKSVNSDLDNFRFGQAAHSLYEFIWHEFADIYLEKSKEQMQDEKLKTSTQNNLFYVLLTSLKLLHPFMPHLTEEVWQKLNLDDDLIVAKWPE